MSEHAEQSDSASRWTWEAHGTVWSQGSMIRGYDDSGIIEADVEGAGEAIRWLLERGPVWDVLDQDKSVTLTVCAPKHRDQRDAA